MHMKASDVIAYAALERHLQYLASLDKLSGNEDSHRAVSYIAEQLEVRGVPYTVEHFQEYLSDPVSSAVRLDDGTEVASRPIRTVSRE